MLQILTTYPDIQQISKVPEINYITIDNIYLMKRYQKYMNGAGGEL